MEDEGRTKCLPKIKRSKDCELSPPLWLSGHGFLDLYNGNNTWDIWGELREEIELLMFWGESVKKLL